MPRLQRHERLLGTIVNRQQFRQAGAFPVFQRRRQIVVVKRSLNHIVERDKIEKRIGYALPIHSPFRIEPPAEKMKQIDIVAGRQFRISHEILGENRRQQRAPLRIHFREGSEILLFFRLIQRRIRFSAMEMLPHDVPQFIVRQRRQLRRFGKTLVVDREDVEFFIPGRNDFI